MLKCPECKARRLTKAGMTWRSRGRVQRWRCATCGRIFTDPINNSPKTDPKTISPVTDRKKTPENFVEKPTGGITGSRP